MYTSLRGKDLIRYFGKIIAQIDGSDGIMLMGDGFMGMVEKGDCDIMEDIYNSSYNHVTRNSIHFINAINKPNIILLFDKSQLTVWDFMDSDFVKSVNGNTDFKDTFINNVIKFDDDKAIITLFSK